jgi:TolB protein
MRAVLGLGLLVFATVPLAAQDPTPPIDRGVRVGITYTAGTRPRLVMLPGPGLDSVRAILQRDLDFSDRFEVLPLGAGGSASGASVNYQLYRTLGAEYGVDVRADATGIVVRLHDIGAGTVRQQQPFALPAQAAPDFRMAVHRVSDEVVRWITGTPGVAATRLLVLMNKRAYRLDSDGAELTAVTPASETILSPTWSPDGRSIAYTRFLDGTGPIILQDLATGRSQKVTGTESQLNFTPAFSPDGRTLAFARTDQEGGTDLYAVNVADQCCLRRLTVGRFADNLSPTYAPDGRRIAFVSTRPGSPQIYAMSADGTDQELLAPYDYGATGASNAPEWSPDGASVAFHRDIDRAPQVFILEVGSRRFKQLTSSGRNSDPTWAPDGRHLAFVSDRSGRAQLWIIDTETGRIRQLPLSGEVRLPHWSRRLGETAH